MSDVSSFYLQQAANYVSDIPWIAQLQKQAQSDLECQGFPARKHEEWKYTSTDELLKHYFVPAHQHNDTLYQHSIPVNGHSISINNGVITGLESVAKCLPDGVIILPLFDAVQSHPEKIKPFLNKILKSEHAFQYLNTAMMQSGLFIYIPENRCIAEPLVLTHYQNQAQQSVYIRHLILAEEGSRATIIEEYCGEDTKSYFTSAITEVSAAATSHLVHYKIQREGKAAHHIAHLAVNQAAGSQFESHVFSFGGKLVRSDITFNLLEPKAHCSMNGVYAPSHGQHMDHHTTVNHMVPNCTSVQDYKGILNDQSRAVFNGKVIVAKDAQQTDAKQQNKNLLLSSNAEIDTKPQLEIYANDVTCTHGATVGQLDEEALFYLATRGIEPSEATQYLVRAFAMTNLQAVQDEKLCAWLSNLLYQQTV